MVGHCRYSSVLYHFRVIWRWITWPWNLGYRSLKVIQTGTIRKLGCGFLFAFHNNYGSILHQFRVKRDISRKSWFCYTTFACEAPVAGDLRRNIAMTFGTQKLVWLPGGEKVWKYVYSFRQNPQTWQTDGQTHIQTPHRMTKVYHRQKV